MKNAENRFLTGAAQNRTHASAATYGAATVRERDAEGDADEDPEWEGILKGGVYHIHKNLGVNESVMWGEYFFLEALEKALAAQEH